MYEIRVGGVAVVAGRNLDEILAEASDSLHSEATGEVWLRGIYVAEAVRQDGRLVPAWTGD